MPGTTAVAVLSLVLLVGLMVRGHPRPTELPRLIGQIWIDPPGAWAAGILGVLLALPVLGLYTPVLLGDADSARVVARVAHVRAYGIDHLLETQDNFIPYLVVGPAVAIGGIAGAKLVALVSVQVLAGVTCYVTQRISGSMLGAAAAALALLAIPAAVDRAGSCPCIPPCSPSGTSVGGTPTWRSRDRTGTGCTQRRPGCAWPWPPRRSRWGSCSWRLRCSC